MVEISGWCAGEKYDFVFTHTCPISWEPRDLFLPMINQGTVDRTMENWLDDVKIVLIGVFGVSRIFIQIDLNDPMLNNTIRILKKLKPFMSAGKSIVRLVNQIGGFKKSPNFYMR